MSNNSNKSGGASAWARPLTKGGNSSGGGGGGGWGNRGGGGGGGSTGSGAAGQRPPPGMERKDFGNNNNRSSNTTSGGWGNRGAANNNSGGGGGGGYVKKSFPPPSSTNSASGSGNAAATTAAAANNKKDILRERFLHLILSMIGQTVTVTTTSNQILEGVFHTFSPFNTAVNKEMRNVYVIKACRTVQPGTDAKGSVEEGSTVLIPSYKVVSVQVKSMRLDAANAAEKQASTVSSASEDPFQTDSQISGGKGGNQGLVAASSVWTSAGDGSVVGGGALDSSAAAPAAATSGGRFGGADALNWRSAASTSRSEIKSAPPSGGVAHVADGGLKGGIGEWDQFAANKEKFNVKATYDENLYTTTLDVDAIDHSKRAAAERLANEIEGTVSTNIHVAQERGQKIMGDYDDEDLYSGVLTKDLKARVVPGSEKKEAKAAAAGGKVMNYAAAANAAAKKEAAKNDVVGEKAEKKASTPDLSKASSEEKKVEEPAAEKAAKGDKVSTDKKEDDDKDKKDSDKKSEETKKPASKLRANAPSFKLNVSAKEWKPTFTVPAPAAPPAAPSGAPPQQPPPPQMDPSMQQHPGEYPGAAGHPMMGQMGHHPGGPGFAPMHGESSIKLYSFLNFLFFFVWSTDYLL